jgi:threonine/homoserine efflux transporter RhtA
VVGGAVTTVGTVTGQYIVTGTSTVTTLQAIANVVVATNGTTITITNNTGQFFAGKALLNY